MTIDSAIHIYYEYFPGGLIPEELLSACANLYSDHYGVWSTSSPKSPGERIRLSSNKLRQWFASNNADIYTAKNDSELIGYAIAIKVKVPKYGIVSWVTQLVVHANFRQQDVAKTLLFSIWGLSDHFAWGIVSANPYAIRALEKATRRRCLPARIACNKRKLLNVGVSNVNYINDKTPIVVVPDQCSKINTQFFVDHSQLEKMILSVTSAETPWVMGQIEEGWEWFAFTFRDQEPISLSAQEIEKMITASDQVTKEAYSRMQLSSSHAWMQHTEKEVDFIVKYCKLGPGQTVIDFGCGTGRHSVSLAKRGLRVIGVDYVEKNIEAAKSAAKSIRDVTFIAEDCRTVKLDQADAAICLYDVIGSYTDNSQNLRILENISNNLRDGGMALISIMNFEVTKFNAKHKFKFSRDPNKLLNLPASQTMETTGNVFNPDYYIVDVETQVVYRKEQFLRSQSLPVELVVKDRRFQRREIEDMCISVSLEIVWSRYVSAGKWDTELECHDPSAKEILVLCKKTGTCASCEELETPEAPTLQTHSR